MDHDQHEFHTIDKKKAMVVRYARSLMRPCLLLWKIGLSDADGNKAFATFPPGARDPTFMNQQKNHHREPPLQVRCLETRVSRLLTTPPGRAPVLEGRSLFYLIC